MHITPFTPSSVSAFRWSYSKRLVMFICLAFAIPLLTACQTTPPVSPEQAANFRQVEYFLALNKLAVTRSATDVRESYITDWGRLNDQALILALGSHRRVLVTLKEPCENLAVARVIGFERALSFVVLDPMGNGFDIRESFGEYLNPGDKIILALTDEELESIQWNPDGPAFGQLGECITAQIYHLEPLVAPNAEGEEPDQTS